MAALPKKIYWPISGPHFGWIVTGFSIRNQRAMHNPEMWEREFVFDLRHQFGIVFVETAVRISSGNMTPELLRVTEEVVEKMLRLTKSVHFSNPGGDERIRQMFDEFNDAGRFRNTITTFGFPAHLLGDSGHGSFASAIAAENLWKRKYTP